MKLLNTQKARWLRVSEDTYIKALSLGRIAYDKDVGRKDLRQN